METILTLLFIILIAGGLIWAYFHYLGEKGERLKLINRGICPKCNQNTIEVVDQKGGGCSGTAFVAFKCSSCGFEDSYNLGSGSSCGGSCKR